MNEVIVQLKDMLRDVSLMLAADVEGDLAVQWKDAADRALSDMLGDDHSYVKDFLAIGFERPVMDGAEDLPREDVYRLGLEDSQSYLVALVDEMESEFTHSPGTMDVETTFAEVNRYFTSLAVGDAQRGEIYGRLGRLRDGLLVGDLNTGELQEHMHYILKYDEGLFDRLVPVLSWYYLQRDYQTLVH